MRTAVSDGLFDAYVARLVALAPAIIVLLRLERRNRSIREAPWPLLSREKFQ